MKRLEESVKEVLESNSNRTLFDIQRLKGISQVITKSLEDLVKLEKMISVSKNPEELIKNKKKLEDKLDKHHKLFSEVYKNPNYSLSKNQ